jgi:flagellar biosynthesis/type III secretory pathway protein FliH
VYGQSPDTQQRRDVALFTYEQGFEEGLEVGYDLGLAEATRTSPDQSKGHDEMSTEATVSAGRP